MDRFNQIMNEEHEGAFAFEYIIVLVIMAVVIFAAWKALGSTVIGKAGDLSSFIANNGTTNMGTSGATTPVNPWGNH